MRRRRTTDIPQGVREAGARSVMVATFYRFTPVDDPGALAGRLTRLGEAAGIRGTVIVAAEGINATVAGAGRALEGWLRDAANEVAIEHFAPRRMMVAENPFYRFKVRVKREIVSLGQPGVAPARRTGRHVAPAAWDDLLADPDVTLLDVRNRYEVALGSFAGALDPSTDSFREFPDFVDRELSPTTHPRVAMFCTGGIRCEKASTWMLAQGYEEVYQLDGGILAYLAARDAGRGRFAGECFLFDQRVAVGYRLAPSDVTLCFGCRYPLAAADRRSPEYEEGVSCARCAPGLTESRRAARRERHRQEHLARRRGERHIGRAAG